MKYTPGPWEWRNVAGAGLQIHGKVPFKANCGEFVLKADYQPLFHLLAYETWIQFEPREWTEMQEANARLIAAAPDLLAACQLTLKHFIELMEVGVEKNTPECEAIDLIGGLLRSSIEKATGEQSANARGALRKLTAEERKALGFEP